MSFADRYLEIRISGNHDIGNQVISDSGCRLSGYKVGYTEEQRP